MTMSAVPGTSAARSQRERAAAFRELLGKRLVILDGAMGTMIQRHKLGEGDFRGSRFAQWPRDLRGNNDLLSITQPRVIESIHREYLDAGADVITTNTFNSSPVSQADYGMQELADELNLAAARLARKAADEVTERTGRQRFVAGALGPTSRTASISPDVNDPSFRNIDFDELARGYAGGTRALIEGGVDVILIETIFDTLNAKAALFAVRETLDELGIDLPIIVSGTITDASGRTLSGQTTEAFWNSVRHVRPAAVGLNCALGGKQLRPYIEELARIADTPVCAYPNAGLPNAFGEYDESARETAEILTDFAASGFVNMVGGCCGTTPEHIRAVAKAVADIAPRVVPTIPACVPSERSRAARHRCAEPVRQCRRAYQRHRLREVPQADRGGRLRGGGGDRPAAGRERRADHRRQHGRGHARLAGRHGEISTPDRRRARRGARAGDD